MRHALLRLLSAFLRRLRPRTHTPPRTLLVLADRIPLGCCVHATPLYAALKQQHPQATLAVATRGLGLEVVQHDPHIDLLFDTGNSLAASPFTGAARLRRQLRAAGVAPDLILQDASSRAGSHALAALLLRLAPTRGFAPLAPLYDEPLVYDPALSLIDNNLRLAGAAHREPAVYFTAADLAHARALLAEPGSSGPVTAFVLQGSGHQPTLWREDRFAQVVGHLEALGHRTVFLGTAADEPLLQRIRALAQARGPSLAGRTSVPQLAAVLCLCDLLISVDTGPLHVGRAAGVPLVVLGPCWQEPLEWLPLTLPSARVLRGPTRPQPPQNYRLDEISVEAVLSAAADLLHAFPPGAAAREQRVARLLSGTRART